MRYGYSHKFPVRSIKISQPRIIGKFVKIIPIFALRYRRNKNHLAPGWIGLIG